MRRSENGRDAISRYLSREWDLRQLYSWALEYWDLPEQREDKWSSDVAGEVLERVRELEEGVRSREEFDQALRDIPMPVTTHL